MVWSKFSKKALLMIFCSPLRKSFAISATLLCKRQSILTMSMLVLSMGMSKNNFRYDQ